jgi:hypothetical protein
MKYIAIIRLVIPMEGKSKDECFEKATKLMREGGLIYDCCKVEIVECN